MAKPVRLPDEIAQCVRERAVIEAGRKWERDRETGKPEQRLDHLVHQQYERVAWHTGKMFAFGGGHQENLERQAATLMLVPDQAEDRFKPLYDRGLAEQRPMTDDPDERLRFTLDMLDKETAAIRAGFLGPQQAVDIAMRPEMDFHEENRDADNMARLFPNYRVATKMSADPQDRAALLNICASSKDNPIPACRANRNQQDKPAQTRDGAPYRIGERHMSQTMLEAGMHGIIVDV